MAKYYRSKTEDGIPSCVALVKDEQVKHNALESAVTNGGETIRLQTIALDAEWNEMPEAEVKKRFPRLYNYITTGKDDYKEPMKLAVIYLLPGDEDSDAGRTELEVFEDFGDMNVLIAHEEATSRERLRREFGEPVYSAIRETPDYRDVDIWEIQSTGRAHGTR